MKLILASGSPRRRELLNMTGLKFEVVTSDADELTEQPIENGTAAVKPRSVNTFLFERASV